jgi:hypothetical protein
MSRCCRRNRPTPATEWARLRKLADGHGIGRRPLASSTVNRASASAISSRIPASARGSVPAGAWAVPAGRGIERRDMLWFRGKGAKATGDAWVIRPLDALAITSCHRLFSRREAPGFASQVMGVGDLSRRENKFEMQSPVNFDTMAAASRAGREALKQLLDKLHAEHLRWPAA